jgi:hypothetical protein
VATLGDVNKRVEQTSVSSITICSSRNHRGCPFSRNNTGSPPVIRVRGLNSLSLSNAPIFIIDGVRMKLQRDRQRLDERRDEQSHESRSAPEIEDIEIVKGPSAATLPMELDAATWRHRHYDETRPRRQVTQWTWNAEAGAVTDPTMYTHLRAPWPQRPTAPTAR